MLTTLPHRDRHEWQDQARRCELHQINKNRGWLLTSCPSTAYIPRRRYSVRHPSSRGHQGSFAPALSDRGDCSVRARKSTDSEATLKDHHEACHTGSERSRRQGLSSLRRVCPVDQQEVVQETSAIGAMGCRSSRCQGDGM